MLAVASHISVTADRCIHPMRHPDNTSETQCDIVDTVWSDGRGLHTLRTSSGVMFRSGLRAALSEGACLPPAGLPLRCTTAKFSGDRW